MSVLLDTNPDNTPRKTRNGYYRFSVVLSKDDGTPQLVIRGFRIARPFQRIQLPISQWRDSVFSQIELSHNAEDKIKEFIISKINEHESQAATISEQS